MVLLALLSPAHAASLDLLEVGGAYGTPGATNPSALWWNPAGLAVGSGKIQFLVDLAPTLGSVTAERANPDYGALAAQPGFPTTYDYSGTDKLSFTGVVPFVGASSNLGVNGLGVGLGLAVPSGRGGKSDQEWGANRFAIRAGSITAPTLIAGAAYQIKGKVAVGVSGQLVRSSWYADSDITTYPDLAQGYLDNSTDQTLPATFQDGFMEDRAYSTTAILGGAKDGGKHGALSDTAVTFGAGIYLTPVRRLGISIGYDHSVHLENTGDVTLQFSCPPDYDESALGVSNEAGLCNRRVDAEKVKSTLDPAPTCDLSSGACVSYTLPSRINVGVVLTPVDRLRLELMGAYVFWSVFDAYDINTYVLPTEFADLNDSLVASEDSKQLSAPRTWARDANDTFWLGLDAKAHLTSHFTGGARVMYDHHAIPDSAVLANNIDNDDLTLGLMGEVDLLDKLGIGLSVDHHFLATREITNSAFAMTLDEANRKPAAYFFPSGNGTYSGSITRFGVTFRGHFGGSPW